MEKLFAICVTIVSMFALLMPVCLADITLVSAGPTVVVKITPEPGDSGVKKLYVGARYNGLFYFRGPTSYWHLYSSGPFLIAGEINVDGPSEVTVVDFDVSSLVGLELYFAYGVSESDALNTPGHMARIYTVPPAIRSGFTHYGFYSYDGVSENDLADLATYTHTTFARTVQQVRLARSYGFRNIIFEFRFEGVLAELIANEGITVVGNPLAYDFRTIYEYERKALELWRRRLVSLRGELLSAGVLNDVGLFILSDEPALHRNYVNQELLNSIEETFKAVFPEKRSTMAFAEDRFSSDPSRGAHLSPPPTLDVVTVDPYFWDNTSIGCSEAEIRRSIYSTNANSTIDWAVQFNKPIVVAGDAMLRSGVDPLQCYITGVYNVLSEDPRVIGLIWFIFDQEFRQGPLTGAANSPALVETIKNLTIRR